MPEVRAATSGRSSTSAGVGIVVRSRDGLVLVAGRRSDPTPSQALPGGKLEALETFEECAIRELAEETGLSMGEATVRTFGCTFVPGEPVGWVVVGVAGEIDRPSTEIEPREVEPKKVGRFRWIDPSRPPADLYPASRALLDYGDSMSDVPLFDAVGYRISINGDHHLRDLCDVDVRGDDLWAAYHHARRYIDQSAA